MSEFRLSLLNGINICSTLRESEISSIKDISKSDMNTGYVWYNLGPCEIEGEQLNISICFYKGKCNSISLALYNPDKYGAGWENWSEEKEKACARDTENWLAKMGYSIGNYSWGTIWAGYDPKGGSGHAGVRFK